MQAKERHIDYMLKQEKQLPKKFPKKHTGTLIVKDSLTGERIGRVDKNHPKVLSGEWEFFHKGMIRSQAYKDKISLRSSGENNPRFSGITDEEIVSWGIELFNLIGEISSLNDLRRYVKIKYNKEIPQHFSKFRFPDKTYYEIIEENTKEKYNPFKRGKIKKEYNEKLEKVLNANN